MKVILLTINGRDVVVVQLADDNVMTSDEVDDIALSIGVGLRAGLLVLDPTIELEDRR